MDTYLTPIKIGARAYAGRNLSSFAEKPAEIRLKALERMSFGLIGKCVKFQRRCWGSVKGRGVKIG